MLLALQFAIPLGMRKRGRINWNPKPPVLSPFQFALGMVTRIMFSVGVGHDEPLDGKFLGILHIGERSFSNRLAGILGDHRFRIEAFQMAYTAIHEEPDDA